MHLITRYLAHTRGGVSYLEVSRAGYLTVTQAATKWGKVTSTVRLWCKMGLIPGAYKKSPRVWLIPAGAAMPVVPHGRQSHKGYRAAGRALE